MTFLKIDEHIISLVKKTYISTYFKDSSFKQKESNRRRKRLPKFTSSQIRVTLSQTKEEVGFDDQFIYLSSTHLWIRLLYYTCIQIQSHYLWFWSYQKLTNNTNSNLLCMDTLFSVFIVSIILLLYRMTPQWQIIHWL